MKEHDFIILMDYYKGALTPKQALALEYYYENNLSLKETAALLKITRAGAYDLIKGASKTVKTLEKQTGFVKKASAARKKLNIIMKKEKDSALKKEIKRVMDSI